MTTILEHVVQAIREEVPQLAEASDSVPAWPMHADEEDAALLRVAHSGKWGSARGSEVQRLEAEMSERVGVRHAFAVTSGTLGLVAALLSIGVRRGDEVVVPSYTFIASASSSLFIGAIPVLVDVDPTTHLLDPVAVERAITPHTRAIVAVHLGGAMADVVTLRRIADKHGLALVEDAAQAIGASAGGEAGSFGDVGVFSFQESKNVSAGEGGLVVTDSEEIASHLYSLINVGRVPGGAWYEHQSIGLNLRMTEFQGAVLQCQLARNDELARKRDLGAEVLQRAFENFTEVVPDPTCPWMTRHAHHLFLMRASSLNKEGLRDAAVTALAHAGVPGVSGGYVPLHRNVAMRRAISALREEFDREPFDDSLCPATDTVCEDTLWLPQSVLLAPAEALKAFAHAIGFVAAHGSLVDGGLA